MAISLSDTKRIILAHAADHPTHRALPIPTAVKAPAPAVTKSLEAMLAAGFLVEVAAEVEDTAWKDTDGGRTTLIVTAAGLAAIGLGEADADLNATAVMNSPAGPSEPTSPSVEPAPAKRSRMPTSSPAPSKQDIVIAMLKQPEGCTIAEMMTATNWQAHSVRGFMSGTLKAKLGLTVTSEKEDKGERRYAITKTEKAAVQ